MVIGASTIANSFGSWLQDAPCQSRRRRRGLAARVVLERIGGFPLSAVWQSGAVKGGPPRTSPSERERRWPPSCIGCERSYQRGDPNNEIHLLSICRRS